MMERRTWPTTTKKKSKNQKRKKIQNRKRPQRIKKNLKNLEGSHLHHQPKKFENHDRDHHQSKASRVERKINQDKNQNQFRGVDQEVDRNQKREEKQAKIGREISLSKYWKILRVYPSLKNTHEAINCCRTLECPLASAAFWR